MGLGQMAGKPALRRQAMLLRRGVATAAVPFPPSGSLAGFGSSHSRSHPSLSHYGSPRVTQARKQEATPKLLLRSFSLGMHATRGHYITMLPADW